MGCASSVNVKIEEDTDNRKILADGKEVGNVKKNNIEKIDEKSEENKEEDYLELHSKTENTQSKTNTKVKIKIKENSQIKINNIKINDKYYNNKSTNFKYMKDDKAFNLIISDQKNKIKNEDNNQNKYISLRHPLDSSLDNNEPINKNLGNINISNEKENNKKNNYGDDEDGVNMGMGNLEEDNNDDMCNLGQSVDLDKVKNNKKQNENEEISVFFEMQTTGVKYNINANKNITLLELIEIFKKKVKLSPFEKPEFVFNDVFLVDFDKPISYYKINNSSKINVYI